MFKKYSLIFIYSNILLYFLYLILINILEAINILSVPESIFSTSFKIKLFFSTLFDYSSLNDLSQLILLLFSILSISLLITLFYILWQKTKEISTSKSFLSFLFLFISVLGLSCAACGIGILASILSFFGFSSLIIYFPLHGKEFAYLGIASINVMNYLLWKRIKSPTTC